MLKNLPASGGDAGDVGSIPGSGRSPGRGNGNPLQYSCLGNPMDRGAWQATVHSVADLDRTEDSTHTHSVINDTFEICYMLPCMLSHPTLCDPMDCSLPGSSVQASFQA